MTMPNPGSGRANRWSPARPDSRGVTPVAEDEFDNLIDNATHAVNNLIPYSLLAGMDAEGRSNLLILINDALAPILRDLGPPEGGDAGPARTRLSPQATVISQSEGRAGGKRWCGT